MSASKIKKKKCSLCGKVLPITEFFTKKGGRLGKNSRCKDCSGMPSKETNIDEFIKLSYELCNDDLAARFNIGAATLSRWKNTLRKKGYKVGTVRRKMRGRITVNEYEPEEWPEVESVGFPESISEDYTKYEVLDRDRCLIFGDVEVPDHDVRVLDMAFRIAERYGLKSGIINGDFLALDSFSSWPKTHPSRHEFIRDEVSPGGEILKVFMRQLDDLLWLEANHERRLSRLTNGQFDVHQLFQNLLGVQYSRYSYMVLNSADEDILVCHPKNTRKKPGSLPVELAGVYLKHVICGHLHRLCFQFHPSGRFWAVEGGHCRDVKKTEYKNRDVTVHGMWNPGFVMVLDGWPHIIEPRTWDAYMQPYQDIEKERKKAEIPEEVMAAEKVLEEWKAKQKEE